MNSNIEKLKEITNNLNPLPFTKMIDKKKSYVKVASTSGTIMLFPIYKDENMAICLSFMSKGTRMAKHIHTNIKEWFIVYKGSYVIRVGDRTKTVKSRDSWYFNPNEEHELLDTLEDSYSLVISIPPDAGFPNGI